MSFLLGAQNRMLDFFDNLKSDFREVYYDSGSMTYFGDYLDKMKLAVAAVAVITIVASSLVSGYFFNLPPLRMALGALALSLTTCSLSAIIFFAFPYYKKSHNKSKLEDNLVYSLSYMAVLSASGMPIEKIIDRVAQIERNEPLRQLAKKFTMNVKVFGYDVLSALRDISNRSPSKVFSNIVYGIRTTVHTSGDLESIFTYEVNREIQKKRESLKKMLSSLVYIGELYVTMMVVAPVLFILMLTILSVIGGGGGSPVLQLNLVTFLGIPVMAATFIILLDIIFGEEE